MNSGARILLALLSVVVIAAGFGYVLATEAPTGSVVGKVLLPDGKTALSDVTVYLTGHTGGSDGEKLASRKVLTRGNGQFQVRRIVAGALHGQRDDRVAHCRRCHSGRGRGQNHRCDAHPHAQRARYTGRGASADMDATGENVSAGARLSSGRQECQKRHASSHRLQNPPFHSAS